MVGLMSSLVLALLLLQDPAGEEIRTLLRRLENPSPTPVETAEIVLRLGQAVEQVAPSQARTLLGDAFRGDRIPTSRRLDLAETLLSLEDGRSWTEEAGRIALDGAEPAETRMRAALLLARADAPRADDVGRALGERLFAEGTDEAARALGAHLRGGASLDQQRREIDYLLRLQVPAAAAALRETLADDAVDPAIRLEIAERLHAAGRLDRVRDARAALEQVRAREPSLGDRVERLLSALRGIREDPASAVASEKGSPAAAKRAREKEARRSPGKVNLIVGGGTLVLLAILLGSRRRG